MAYGGFINGRRRGTREGSRGDDGDLTPSSRGVDPVANKLIRNRQLMRALEGTVGVILTVTAAVLLARSEEIGEWLRSVAPNVMPDAAAGADVVHRAIEKAKTCLQRDGLNVCLDAEGRVTALYAYISQWYLSPKQHVMETGISILVLAPLSYLWFMACQARARSHYVKGTFDVKRPSLLMRLWGMALLACVGVGVAFKMCVNELISHPAYIWQPCHVHSFVMGVCSFFAREWSLLVMHVATTLWWGPFLAFIAPSLPSHPIEVVVFWVQHSFMLLAPFLRLWMGGEWMYRDFWWNSVGSLFLTCYHWWWLAPINIVTGVNVATMTVPPDSLAGLGRYYRLVWGIACILLHAVAVLVVCGIALRWGRWPPSSSPTTLKTPRDWDGNRKAEVDRAPVDAVTISHKEAALSADGN